MSTGQAAAGQARVVVLVNGLPGAGKSTLATALATELCLPVFGKDLIKQSIAEVLGSDSPGGGSRRAWNATLGAASSEAVWALLSYAHCGAVLDSNLSAAPELALAGLRRAEVSKPLEIWCEVPVEIARERYRQRAPFRHPIHQDQDQDRVGPEQRDDWWEDQNHPLGLGPVLRVSTSSAVDIAQVTTWCRTQAVVGSAD